MTVDELVELTKEVESEDPIDWGMLNIDEEGAIRLVALSVFEMYDEWKNSDSTEDIMLTTITKLVLENFALNLRLQKEK